MVILNSFKLMKKIGLISAIVLLFLSWSISAKAVTKIEIEGDTPIKNKVIRSGAIRVIVNYKPVNLQSEDSADSKNLLYQIFYNSKLRVQEGDFTMYTGSVSLEDLDNDKIDEIIVSTYSGGAHCCTNFVVYTWQNNRFVRAETGFLDGGGGSFEDLDEDGKLEFITYDNAFLYRFSSYAGSFPPSLIYRFNQGKFEKATKKYPKELRERLQEMKAAFPSIKKDESEVNGFLAGYVAQKILLGEYEDGWKFMLDNYDKKSDWGLEVYDNNGNVIKRYPDFPTALKAFLIKQGYLNK